MSFVAVSKPKESFDIFVLQVAVDCLRTSDYLDTCVVSVAMSYSASVAAFVLESSPPMILIAVRPFCFAFSATIANCSFCFKLCSAGTNDIKTTGISGMHR